MKLILTILALAFLLTACQPHDAGRGKPEVTGTTTR